MANDSELPAVWVIGFTGHRHLAEPAKVADLLHQAIESVRADIRGDLLGYSSIAIGADALFAQACLSAGIPWIALLPQPEHEFQKDFQEADWARTSELLKQASRVDAPSRTTDREQAYLECGLNTVETADVMVAVWDGKSSRGMGGTAEVVAHTRNLGKPLVLIDPNRLASARERFAPALFSDPEMTALNRIRTGQVPAGSPSGPEERVRGFFEKVDAQAARIAPRFRRWVAGSFLMNTLAAILVAAAVAFDLNSYWFEGIILMLLAAAFLAIVVIKRRGAHSNWIRCRVAAEICRSALATWNLGQLAKPLLFDQLEGFGRLTKSLRLLRLTDRTPCSVDPAKWRETYLERRIEPQLEYLARRRRKLNTLLTALMSGFWIFSALGIARAIYAALVLTPHSDPLVWRVLHSFLPIALPLAAGGALSLISIFDLNRQSARASATEAALTNAWQRVKPCQDLSTLRHAVEHTENVFAADLLEWFTLNKYPRFK